MYYKAPNYQLIELVVPVSAGAQTPVYFQNQPQLQSVIGDKRIYITAIETFTTLMLHPSPITAGNPVAAITDIVNATLTLNVAGTLAFQFIPMASLLRLYLEGSTAVATGTNVHAQDLFAFDSLYQVDWTKSYVQLNAAPVTAPPYSYLFGVYYYWGQNC